MCTCLIAGKNATATGRAMLAANDDWENVEGVLTTVPPATHTSGERHLLTGGQTIPEAAETCGYTYTACRYSIGTLDKGWAGGVNDRGVAVAGTGVDAWKDIPWKDCGYLLEPDDVLLLILQRGTSARQAVRMIGDLIQEYGLRPSYAEGSAGGSAATFSIADATEGWVLEAAPGRNWVAVRVSDDEISVRVNAFGTHETNLTDAENVMAAPGLADYARERGFWEGDERHFDFAAAFGADVSPTEWGPERDPMNWLRRWRAMCLVTGETLPEEAAIYSARPAHPVVKEDLIRILSDVYEGTAYDLTKDENGKAVDPLRHDLPYYALCRPFTVASIVADHEKENDRERLWVAMGPPRVTAFQSVAAG